MTYFLTCFAPFGGLDTNSSEQILKYLELPYIQLPVSWDKVTEPLDYILNQNPDYLILCGQASSYNAPTIELVSTNVTKGNDEDGNIQTFNEEEFLTIPIHTRFDINYSGLGFNESSDCGTYLCNYAYNYAQTHAKNTKVVFIHFPLIRSNLDLNVYSTMLKLLLERIN